MYVSVRAISFVKLLLCLVDSGGVPFASHPRVAMLGIGDGLSKIRKERKK